MEEEETVAIAITTFSSGRGITEPLVWLLFWHFLRWLRNQIKVIL